MEKTKMTIHRALAELKLIDSRVLKAIDEFEPVGTKQEGSLVNNQIDEDTFKEKAAAKYQSIGDLIKRKIVIKSAIVTANASTTIKVGNITMTIAEAISFKEVVKLKKALIASVEANYTKALKTMIMNNEKVDANALQLAQAALSKDNVKITDNEAVSITEPYLKKNKVHLVDSLEVKDMIESLNKEVTDFETEIDAVLSEINATTFIEV